MQWEYKAIKIGYLYGPRPQFPVRDREGEATACLWLSGGKFDAISFNKMINELGRERWELVSVFDALPNDGNSSEIVAVFKKPLEQ